ncbi:MAG TPA: sigma-70 family RNA polymerase sigma factor, partial [Ilumatobacteraceae bacterium]|nr:sigma-70 family RNA polymerase sigma factor [Ilumatobacteraceae bacterium]
ERLRWALAQVPPRQRAALVLRYYDDLSEAETAAALGCSLGTVKSQTAKGLARLRTLMATEHDG